MTALRRPVPDSGSPPPAPAALLDFARALARAHVARDIAAQRADSQRVTANGCPAGPK